MNHLERFESINSLLHAEQSLWWCSPFMEANPAWQTDHVALFTALMQLDDATVSMLDLHPEQLLPWLSIYLPSLRVQAHLCDLPSMSSAIKLPFRWSTDVPGRKWQQIESFLGAVANGSRAIQAPIVDWCAGKSFLGQNAAAYFGTPLRAIERDPALCLAGQAMSQQRQLNARFECKDVLSHSHSFSLEEQVFALHACGDLHRHLIKEWVVSDSVALFCSPCCYHLWLNAPYQSLSPAGKASGLVLEKNHLQLAVQETVTSSNRKREQVDTLATWRLAFDVWQREVRGIDAYWSTPSLPLSVLNDGFASFMQTICARKQVSMPDQTQLSSLLSAGEERFAKAKRLQLVRHGFRRLIELWLALDLVLFLENGGARVTLSTFCERSLTPRNLLISATKP